MDEDLKESLFIIFMVFFSLIFGIFIGVGAGSKMEEKNAVKAGAAYYTNDVDGESVFKYHSANK